MMVETRILGLRKDTLELDALIDRVKGTYATQEAARTEAAARRANGLPAISPRVLAPLKVKPAFGLHR
jgi:hypothetical protein